MNTLQLFTNFCHYPFHFFALNCASAACLTYKLNTSYKSYESIITDGDLTDVLNVDVFYDYFGKMNEFGFYGYATQESNLCVNKTEQCYIKPRLIYDDGG